MLKNEPYAQNALGIVKVLLFLVNCYWFETGQPIKMSADKITVGVTKPGGRELILFTEKSVFNYRHSFLEKIGRRSNASLFQTLSDLSNSVRLFLKLSDPIN